MIAGSFGRHTVQTARDHETGVVLLARLS